MTLTVSTVIRCHIFKAFKTYFSILYLALNANLVLLTIFSRNIYQTRKFIFFCNGGSTCMDCCWVLLVIRKCRSIAAILIPFETLILTVFFSSHTLAKYFSLILTVRSEKRKPTKYLVFGERPNILFVASLINTKNVYIKKCIF